MKTRILCILALLLVSWNKDQTQQQAEIVYSPIGVIHSSFTPETGAPRQGILIPETGAEIEIYKPYREALQSLDLFEYIIVIYHFDKITGWKNHAIDCVESKRNADMEKELGLPNQDFIKNTLRIK